MAMYSCTGNNRKTSYKKDIQLTDHQFNAMIDNGYVLYESVDTTEFVVYWKLFRKAILEQDTITLSTMINDSIDGGWFLIQDYSEHLGKISKSFFLCNLYTLFTPEFLSLLKSYEIEKYLGHNRKNILWETAPKKTYESCIEFGHSQINLNAERYNVAYYKMFWRRDKEGYPENCVMRVDDLDFLTIKQIFIERDFERLDHLIYDLMFIKSSGKIKLHSVELSYIFDISD